MNINAISANCFKSFKGTNNKSAATVSTKTNSKPDIFETKASSEGTSSKNKLLNIFENLVKIPSPSLKEEKVAKWILDYCVENKINAWQDNYGNVRIKIPATDNTKDPILLSAHMDVVGDSSPINLKKENDYYMTDGKRTLGADDKAGVATALCLADDLIKSDIKHGGLEIIYTRDEESGMSGIDNADLKDIDSKHVLVLDGEKVGRFENAGAGYTNATLSVKTKYGGHSGVDIHEKERLNAATLIAELISELPQGVFYSDETGTVTSINLGTIIAGNIQNNAAKIVEDKIVSDDYSNFFIDNAVTNVINKDAKAKFSIRSSSEAKEEELHKLMEEKINKFNEKYKGLATASVNFEVHLPKFEAPKDKSLEEVYTKACEKVDMEPHIGSFHAAAETHVYAQNKNRNGETYSPVLMGVADIYDMHSPSEKVNVKTLEKGYDLIKQMFLEYNNQGDKKI